MKPNLYLILDNESLKYEFINSTKIYSQKEFKLNEYLCDCSIIGLSHYIEIPKINYYELFSCIPPKHTTPTYTLDLLNPPLKTTTLKFKSSKEFTIYIWVENKIDDISQISDENSLVWEFEKNAITKIKIIDKGWITYHYYPEYGLKVVTKTIIN